MTDVYTTGPRTDTTVSPIEAMARKGWMWLLGLGAVSVILGIIVLAWPDRTLRVVGVLFGIFLLVSGIIEILVAFAPEIRTSTRVLSVLVGVLSILLGLICFRGPLESVLLLALWIGFSWLITGITRIVAAASAEFVPYRGWQIFGGALLAIAGIVVIVSPLASIAALAVLAGIWLLVLGIWQIVEAFVLRRHIEQATAVPR
jgi:uncharacterized membrane protein HdeD (DUF308 family)